MDFLLQFKVFVLPPEEGKYSYWRALMFFVNPIRWKLRFFTLSGCKLRFLRASVSLQVAMEQFELLRQCEVFGGPQVDVEVDFRRDSRRGFRKHRGAQLKVSCES